MPNLLHGHEVIREFFQERAKPQALVEECSRLIEEEAYRNQVANSLRMCREKLGVPGASGRAAIQILNCLDSVRAEQGSGFALSEI